MSHSRHVNFHLGMPPEDMADLESRARKYGNPKAKYDTVAEALRETSRLGRQMDDWLEIQQDPVKRNELAERMEKMAQDEKMNEHAQSLTDEELSGYRMCYDLETERRARLQGLR